MEDDIKLEDLINMRDMYKVEPKRGPVVDKLVSELVGKTIYTTNPILIKKIAEWKKEKGDSEEPDNWMNDPDRLEELKKIL